MRLCILVFLTILIWKYSSEYFQIMMYGISALLIDDVAWNNFGAILRAGDET